MLTKIHLSIAKKLIKHFVFLLKMNSQSRYNLLSTTKLHIKAVQLKLQNILFLTAPKIFVIVRCQCIQHRETTISREFTFAVQTTAKVNSV